MMGFFVCLFCCFLFGFSRFFKICWVFWFLVSSYFIKRSIEMQSKDTLVQLNLHG